MLSPAIGWLLRAGWSRSFSPLKVHYRPLIRHWLNHRIRARPIVELDLEVVGTNSLVRHATTIYLEKDEKGKFSKKTQYSSKMLWRETLTSTSSTIESQQTKAFSWISSNTCPDTPLDVAVFGRSARQLSFIIEEHSVEHDMRCSESCTEPGFTLAHQVKLCQWRISRTLSGTCQHHGQRGP